MTRSATVQWRGKTALKMKKGDSLAGGLCGPTRTGLNTNKSDIQLVEGWRNTATRQEFAVEQN